MKALFLIPPILLAACAGSATSAPAPTTDPPVSAPANEARRPICDAKCRAAIDQLQRAADRLDQALSRANKAVDP
jgi:hypothetical protein